MLPAVGRLVDVHATGRMRDRHIDDVGAALVERERLSPVASRNRSKRRNWPARLASCAARPTAERRSSGAATTAPVEADQTGHPNGDGDGERGSVPDPPAPCPPARLLDQCLEIRDTLPEIPILLDLWRTRLRGEGHGNFIFMTLY